MVRSIEFGVQNIAISQRNIAAKLPQIVRKSERNTRYHKGIVISHMESPFMPICN